MGYPPKRLFSHDDSSIGYSHMGYYPMGYSPSLPPSRNHTRPHTHPVGDSPMGDSPVGDCPIGHASVRQYSILVF